MTLDILTADSFVRPIARNNKIDFWRQSFCVNYSESYYRQENAAKEYLRVVSKQNVSTMLV